VGHGRGSGKLLGFGDGILLGLILWFEVLGLWRSHLCSPRDLA